VKKKDLRACSLNEINEFLSLQGEKKFHTQQIYDWIWKNGAKSIDEISNLSIKTRKIFSENFSYNPAKIDSHIKSTDGTLKFSFKLFDDNFVEGVIIPDKDRVTACISTQVGCALNCGFCATGLNGFIRDLEYAEIFDQIALLNEFSLKTFQKKLSNIVYMGMGEPFINYDNTIKSLKIITDSKLLGFSPQRITVSTSGITEKIKAFADENINANLAVSLHSAIDEKRSFIMPINKKYPLADLKESLMYFYSKTNNRITFEYLILDNFNDSLDDAIALAKYCRSFPVKINIIKYNSVNQTNFKKSNNEKIEKFKNYLESKNMIVMIRKSRGEEIVAACGQLANKENKKQKNNT